MNAYTPGIERMMKRLFDSLRENDRRRYAAIEATKLGHGGVEYIVALSGGAIPRPFDREDGNWKRGTTWTPDVSEKGWPQTVDRQLPDPRGELPEGASRPHRRRSDASRRQVDEPVAAGDRQATHRDGDAGSRNVVSSLLRKHVQYAGGKLRRRRQWAPQSQPKAQFENIARLKKEYLKAGLPVISMDTKKKELLEQFLPRRQDRHAGNH